MFMVNLGGQILPWDLENHLSIGPTPLANVYIAMEHYNMHRQIKYKWAIFYGKLSVYQGIISAIIPC